MRLTSLGIGGFVEYASGPVYVQATAGLIAHLVETHATRSEILYGPKDGEQSAVLKSWDDEERQSAWSSGFFAELNAGVVISSVRVGVFGRYSKQTSLSGPLGPSTYDVMFADTAYGIEGTWCF